MSIDGIWMIESIPGVVRSLPIRNMWYSESGFALIVSKRIITTITSPQIKMGETRGNKILIFFSSGIRSQKREKAIKDIKK